MNSSRGNCDRLSLCLIDASTLYTTNLLFFTMLARCGWSGTGNKTKLAYQSFSINLRITSGIDSTIRRALSSALDPTVYSSLSRRTTSNLCSAYKNSKRISAPAHGYSVTPIIIFQNAPSFVGFIERFRRFSGAIPKVCLSDSGCFLKRFRR